MKTSHTFNALLMAAAVLGTPAHAASADVSASITGFTLQLIDLDTADGIAPSIAFADPYTQLHSNGQYTYQNLYEYGSTSVVQPHGSTSASLSLTGLSSHAAFTSGARGDQWFESSASDMRFFTLSPSTGLLITATGHIDISQADADRTGAFIGMSLSLDWSQDGISGNDWRNQSYRISEGSRDYRLSAYLASGKVAQTGSIFLSTQATTALYAAPVPEPETWGMLLAGALVIGGMARRRRHG